MPKGWIPRRVDRPRSRSAASKPRGRDPLDTQSAPFAWPRRDSLPAVSMKPGRRFRVDGRRAVVIFRQIDHVMSPVPLSWAT